jgi:hypothetical protein
MLVQVVVGGQSLGPLSQVISQLQNEPPEQPAMPQ